MIFCTVYCDGRITLMRCGDSNSLTYRKGAQEKVLTIRNSSFLGYRSVLVQELKGSLNTFLQKDQRVQ